MPPPLPTNIYNEPHNFKHVFVQDPQNLRARENSVSLVLPMKFYGVEYASSIKRVKWYVCENMWGQPTIE